MIKPSEQSRQWYDASGGGKVIPPLFFIPEIYLMFQHFTLEDKKLYRTLSGLFNMAKSGKIKLVR
jgi:hypothetical protein